MRGAGWRARVARVYRGKAGTRPPAGLIFHSDRGSECLGAVFRSCLTDYGVRQSMTGGGAPGENAHMESFFHSLKADYNHQRLHSALDYQSPIDYERTAA